MLVGSEKFDECLNYIKKKRLYRHGLKIFYHNKEMYKKVMGLFAIHLQEEGKFIDAALAYQISDDYKSSIECFKACGKWKEALKIARKIEYSNEDYMELANELSGKRIFDKLY